MIENIESGDSWRDQPFVWMIIAIPASAIVASMVMLTLAIQSDSGLVVDDYYKKGKEINRVLARDSLARSLGINALLTLDKDLGLIKVTLNGDNLNIGAKPLELQFLHSTRQSHDQVIRLQGVTDSVFTARFAPLPPGRWNVQIATDEWRIIGSAKIPGSDSIQLIATGS
jgi:hypothetical protein